jgi:hypothetical protein
MIEKYRDWVYAFLFAVWVIAQVYENRQRIATYTKQVTSKIYTTKVVVENDKDKQS